MYERIHVSKMQGYWFSQDDFLKHGLHFHDFFMRIETETDLVDFLHSM